MPDSHSPHYNPEQDLAFALMRILFGVIWVVNTILQANAYYVNHFLGSIVARIKGQTSLVSHYLYAVVHVLTVLGPRHVAIGTVVLDAILALSLLTGLALRPLARLGMIYTFFLWTTVGGFGGPYIPGATDPGTAIVYTLTFFTILSVPSEQRLTVGGHVRHVPETHEIEIVRVLFGLLWLFDAFWKWQPAFLEHSLSYLRASQVGQPGWIVAYIGLFIHIIRFVGPLLFGLFAALAETLLGLSLLTERGLKWSLQLGFFSSFGVWTTAEGWGGPYAWGSTGNRGDMLGTADMYMIVYLYLIVAYLYKSPKKVL